MSTDKATQGSDFDGLEWVRDRFWNSEPRWTVEPDEEAIKQTVTSSLGLPSTTAPYGIEFLAQGAFNKVYVITFAEKEVIARVTLPADPKWKTLSEVATLQWVRDNTSLPVPEVLSYQADRASPVGFEWIAMSKMPGGSLHDRWRDIALSAKEDIARRLAVFCSDTFRAQLRGIGNLFFDRDTKEAYAAGSAVLRDRGAFRVDRIISSEFIWDYRIHAEVSRGPFNSTKDWLLARLSLAEAECRGHLSRLQSTTPVDEEEKMENEAGLEDIENTMDIVSRLRRQLDDFFPPPSAEPERTMVLHDDLSSQNILVDDHGNLTAVVDWECISAVPLWFACQIPPVLQGTPRHEEPVKAEYQHDEEGNVIEIFWEHLEEYELTQLRRVFLGEMGELQPEWVRIFESSQRQRDFGIAVTCCSDAFLIGTIRDWLGDVEKGVEGFRGLEERIDDA